MRTLQEQLKVQQRLAAKKSEVEPGAEVARLQAALSGAEGRLAERTAAAVGTAFDMSGQSAAVKSAYQQEVKSRAEAIASRKSKQQQRLEARLAAKKLAC